jgi:hypothetical protein
MPLTLSLEIDMELRSSCTGKIVKDFLECKPNLDSEDDHLVGQNGEVEVKITWSD